MTQELPPVVLLSMTAAANACGVSQSTIKRRRVAGEFPNAHQAEDGTWLIPTPDLLAAGLRPNRPRSATTPVDPPVSPPGHPGQGDLAQEVTRLAVELAEERAARKVAEAQAAAYQRNLDDLRLALRAIAGPEPEPPRAVHAMRTPEPAAATPRRKWWQRALITS